MGKIRDIRDLRGTGTLEIPVIMEIPDTLEERKYRKYQEYKIVERKKTMETERL